MAAGKSDILVEQGVTFEQDFTFEDEDGVGIDVSAYTFKGQVRRFSGAFEVVAEFTVTPDPSVTSRIKVSLTPAQTQAFPVKALQTGARQSTELVYDLHGTRPDGKVLRLLEGKVEVSPGVTR